MAAAAPPRRIRVAVADDTADMRLLLRTAMERRNDVELIGEATNGQEAIELAAALRPDLLVLDLAMPVLDGFDALPTLATVAPDTRIVILSALPATIHAVAARDAGAAAYLEKSAPIEVLIDELLRGANLVDAVLEGLSAAARLALGRDPTGPAQARRFVGATLGSWQETTLVDTVQLLVTELVTNVLVHTTTMPNVRIALLRDRVHVEVSDSDPTPPTVRHPPATAASGRGMALVQALASTWGTIRVDGGKVVWFDLERTRAEQ
jgi:DNA-binding NarL/FixJ family response regulator